jgi:hypothetical protein
VEKFRFLHISYWKRFILFQVPKELLTENVIFARNIFDESLVRSRFLCVEISWFLRNLLETTYPRLIDVTTISKNIAPYFVNNSPFLIVYKKLRMVSLGTHYGLSMCCVYTLANQKINYSQNCRTNFSDIIAQNSPKHLKYC